MGRDRCGRGRSRPDTRRTRWCSGKRASCDLWKRWPSRATGSAGRRRRGRPGRLLFPSRYWSRKTTCPPAATACLRTRPAPARRPPPGKCVCLSSFHSSFDRESSFNNACDLRHTRITPQARPLLLMFRYLQSRIRGTASTGPGEPPPGLLAFYWHFVRQTKVWYALMFVTSLAVALIDTAIPVFIGRLVSLMEAPDRPAALDREWPLLAGMVALVLVVRPLANLADMLIRQNALIPGGTSMIRWQSHWHVVRQNWPFFQNDFAGRIANRVMQTANALRESVMASIRAVWYIAVYGVSAFGLMALADWRLGLPTLLWFLGYIVFLRYFVPRMRDLAKTSSEVRSHVMARVVDSYTNILTVKLFARLADEDAYVREVIDEHQGAIGAHMRLISQFMFSLSVMNAALLTATAAIGIWLWAQGTVGAGVVATALPLAWQIANVAGWVSWEVTGIFESIGVVQEGMQTIAVPHSGGDGPAGRGPARRGAGFRSEAGGCNYGRRDGKPVFDRLNLTIRRSEERRVGKECR